MPLDHNQIAKDHFASDFREPALPIRQRLNPSQRFSLRLELSLYLISPPFKLQEVHIPGSRMLAMQADWELYRFERGCQTGIREFEELSPIDSSTTHPDDHFIDVARAKSPPCFNRLPTNRP